MISDQTCLFIAHSKIMSFWGEKPEFLNIMQIITEKELGAHQLQARFSLLLSSRCQNASSGTALAPLDEKLWAQSFRRTPFCFLLVGKVHVFALFFFKWFRHFMDVLLSFLQKYLDIKYYIKESYKAIWRYLHKMIHIAWLIWTFGITNSQYG